MSSLWDDRYKQQDYLFGTAPNDFLRSQAWRFPPAGQALAVADGEGRNGVFLAERGLAVTSIDSSAVGVAKAQALAESRGVFLDARVGDLFAWDWPVGRFDVIASVFVHMPPPDRVTLHARVAAALAPGGLLVLEAYRPDQIGRGTGGPPTPDRTYTNDMLAADFAALDLLELTAGTALLREGPGHDGIGSIVRYVGRRPG